MAVKKGRASEEYLDALVRHQVYLEGYKTYQGAQFEKTAKEIERSFKDMIGKLDVKSMDELSKAKLLSFIASLRKVQTKIFARYNDQVLSDFEKFVKVDWTVIAQVFDEEKPLPIPKSLFKKLLGQPIASIGQFVDKMMATIGNGMIVKSERVITQAWAEAWDKARTLTELIGEPVNVEKRASPNVGKPKGLQTVTTDETLSDGSGKPKVKVPTAVIEPPSIGGVVNAARQENQTAISTALQHLSTGVKETVIKKYSSHYVWVSVIDSRTTEICTERDGRVYETGNGDLPPAHRRCRSTIAPWDGTYYKSEFEDKDPDATIGR